MFQIISGLSRSRLRAQQRRLGDAKSNARSTWKHSCASRRSGCASSTIDAGVRKALRGLAGDRRDFGIDRRDAEVGRIGDALRLAAGRAADRNDAGSAGSDKRIAGLLAAHRVEQQRHIFDVARHRPCDAEIAVDRGRDRCATRPMLGRKPTMPQKLAGLRSEPPMSEPCASHAMPVASATAAPPEEPAAERDVSQGLRVAPNTSLKVLAPAPNSGVFDLA